MARKKHLTVILLILSGLFFNFNPVIAASGSGGNAKDEVNLYKSGKKLVYRAKKLEKKDKIKILKLNVDENPLTPQKFGVRGIPSLMLFKDGNLVDTKVGSLPKNMLESWLESNL